MKTGAKPHAIQFKGNDTLVIMKHNMYHEEDFPSLFVAGTKEIFIVHAHSLRVIASFKMHMPKYMAYDGMVQLRCTGELVVGSEDGSVLVFDLN